MGLLFGLAINVPRLFGEATEPLTIVVARSGTHLSRFIGPSHGKIGHI